ncbi:MAG: hypothetical protein P8Y36_12385 [Alphaproteobacteria bacterium]
MIKKMSAVAATALLACSLSLTGIGNALAGGHHHHHRHHGRGAAIVGGIALGILAAEAAKADREDCYRGPRECRWVRKRCWYDDYGDRVCRRGHRVCHRPLICD